MGAASLRRISILSARRGLLINGFLSAFSIILHVGRCSSCSTKLEMTSKKRRHDRLLLAKISSRVLCGKFNRIPKASGVSHTSCRSSTRPLQSFTVNVLSMPSQYLATSDTGSSSGKQSPVRYPFSALHGSSSSNTGSAKTHAPRLAVVASSSLLHTRMFRTLIAERLSVLRRISEICSLYVYYMYVCMYVSVTLRNPIISRATRKRSITCASVTLRNVTAEPAIAVREKTKSLYVQL